MHHHAPMPAIDVQGLNKTFRSGSRRARTEVEAVRSLDLTVEHGERIAYIGPNGAGKSTSIKIFTGILHPTSGAVDVLGLVPWKERRRLAQRIGVLFGQRSQLWPELTARQSLRLLAAIYGLDRSQGDRRIDEVTDLLHARDLLDQPSRGYSLGQRMRCELAATLLHQPEILFLDEPTIGLDLVAKQTFRELVSTLNQERGTTIFLTSHDVSDIEAVAERVVIVNHGTVIYDDTVPALRRSLLSTKLIDVRLERSPRPEQIAADLRMRQIEIVEHTSDTWRLRVDTAVQPVRLVLDHLLEQYEVADISVTDPPLEDVIGAVYARTEQ